MCCYTDNNAIITIIIIITIIVIIILCILTKKKNVLHDFNFFHLCHLLYIIYIYIYNTTTRRVNNTAATTRFDGQKLPFILLYLSLSVVNTADSK